MSHRAQRVYPNEIEEARVETVTQCLTVKSSPINEKNKIWFVNSLASGCFQRFSKKNALTHVALRGNFSGPVCSTDLVNVSKDAASLLVCTQKKIFAWGMCFFC